MKVENLKKRIKKKFGTYSNFARLAGIDRYAFQKDFLTKKDVSREYFIGIVALVEKTRDRPSKQPFTRQKLKSLKTAINEAGGVIAFCAENDEFSRDTVFQILAYREAYRTVTPMVKKLLDHFNIKV